MARGPRFTDVVVIDRPRAAVLRRVKFGKTTPDGLTAVYNGIEVQVLNHHRDRMTCKLNDRLSRYFPAGHF